MVEYFNETICRQKVIVDYFGENGVACGKCDICLGASASTLTYEDTQKVLKHLLHIIHTAPYPLKKYIDLYRATKWKALVVAALGRWHRSVLEFVLGRSALPLVVTVV